MAERFCANFILLILLPDIFSSWLCGKKCPDNPPLRTSKVPGKSLQMWFVCGRNATKHINFFQHKLFGPHPKKPILGPRRKFMCHRNFFGGILGVKIQQFRRVTSVGSLPPKTLGKSRGPPQNPAETPQNPRRDPAEPSETPPQSPLRGKFPRRASRRVVPLGW